MCRFDRYGDWRIAGRDGYVFADGKGYLIVVMTAESVRRWKNQDGDDEGCFTLIGDRLPMKPT